MAWQQVNPHGSGFQNALGVGPWTGQDAVVIVGGDTAGIHKSVNRGDVFANRDASITGTNTHIASIEPHPTQSGRWFMLCGNGTSGGLFESTDNGDTWHDASVSAANVFGDGALLGNSGASSLLGNGNGEHPRSVGRLIAVDAAGGYIYVGTFKKGLYRGTLGASTGITSWTLIGLAPGGGTTAYYIRGVTYDPVNDVVYASTFSDPGSDYLTQGGHVYRVTTPHGGGPTATALTGSPFCASAMLLIGDRLYTVAHPITANLTSEGLWYLDLAHSAAAATAWTKIGQLPTAGSERWMSIDGFKVGSTTTLWCGCAGMGTHSLCKLTNSGAGWTGTIYPTNTNTTHNDMGGPNTPADTWWMWTYRNTFMLGRSTFVASTIRINPQNTQEVYVSGRSGVWHTTDGGANWYPVVKGIGATVTLTVFADPRTQGRAYIGLGDWSILASSDNLDTVLNLPPPSGSFAYSTAIDESTNPVTLFTSASPRQDSASYTSKIYRNPDILGSGAWVDTLFSVANVIVTGLGVVYSGSSRVLVASTGAGQLWRKPSDGGAWALVPAANMTPNGGLAFTATDTTPFARRLDVAGVIYLYDRATGIWRSTDAGLHWVRIWNHPSNNSDQAGWVACHPSDPAKLYVSDNTSVYLITNAGVAGQDAAAVTTIGAAIGARGPMIVDPVNLKIGVCDITSTPRFWESPLTPVGWVDKSDSLYQNAVAAPQWASYDRAGRAIIALSGNGVIMQAAGNPLTPPSFQGVPTIIGSVTGGSTVSCVDATAVGNPAPVVTRKWLLDGADTGQSGTTFAIPATTDDGRVLSVTNHAVNSQGVADATSLPSAAITTPVTPPPVWSVQPSVTGATAPNGQAGDTLTGVNGTVSPGSVTSRKWQTSPTGLPGSESDIGGATTTTLVTDAVADIGTYKRYVPHAVNGGTTADQPSPWIGPLAPPPVSNTAPANTRLPAISVSVTTLTIDDGDWTGTPVPTLTRQLRYSTDGGTVWLDTGATGHSYTVPQALYNAIFDVIVSATNGVAPDASAMSAPTPPVAAPDWDVTVVSTDLQEIILRVRQRGV